jgi:hypothetical protein
MVTWDCPREKVLEFEEIRRRTIDFGVEYHKFDLLF